MTASVPVSGPSVFWERLGLPDHLRDFCLAAYAEDLVLTMHQGPGMVDVEWLTLDVVGGTTGRLGVLAGEHGVDLSTVDGLLALVEPGVGTCPVRVSVSRTVWESRDVWLLMAGVLADWDGLFRAGEGEFVTGGCGLPPELAAEARGVGEFADAVQRAVDAFPDRERDRAMGTFVKALCDLLVREVLSRVRSWPFTRAPVASGVVVETFAGLLSDRLPPGRVRLELGDQRVAMMALSAWGGGALLESARALEGPGRQVSIAAPPQAPGLTLEPRAS